MVSQNWLSYITYLLKAAEPFLDVVFAVPTVLILIGCILLLRWRSLWVYVMLVGNIGSIVLRLANMGITGRLRAHNYSNYQEIAKWMPLLTLGGLLASFMFAIGFMVLAVKYRSLAGPTEVDSSRQEY